VKRHLAADAYACVRIPGLLGEGAVQVLYSTDDYIVDPILAAVGQLQVRTWLHASEGMGVRCINGVAGHFTIQRADC